TAGGLGGDEAVAAVRDVGEGATVDERRGAAEGLHEVGVQRVAQQGGERALDRKVAYGDRPATISLADHDVGELSLQISQVRGEAEDRHHLAGGGDVEARFSRGAVGRTTEPGDDGTQAAVVDVHATAPGDPARVDAELVALLDVVVDEGSEGVVCGGEGVHVAGEVEVDVLHRDDLRVAAAGRATLDAHDWALGRFADRDDGVLPGGAQGVSQADKGGGLAFARGGGGHGCHEDGAAQGLVPHVGGAQGGDVHLGLGGAVGDEC